MAAAMKIMEFLQVYVLTNPPPPPKNADPIRFGVLGAANINPLAIFLPAASHPDAVVVAVAARDINRAKKQADKYGIPRTYGSYDELLEQPDIDAVYIGLPNGLHAGLWCPIHLLHTRNSQTIVHLTDGTFRRMDNPRHQSTQTCALGKTPGK